MKTATTNRPVIVGIFIFLGLGILFVTISTLGGQKETFIKTFALNAIFNDVGGLTVGGNIWFSGVKVGTVKKIGFYGNSQVQVTMNIEKGAQSHIHKDAMAKIGSDGLIGNKIIVIYGGDNGKPQVEKNDFLEVEDTKSTEDMMAMLQVSNKNLLDITTNFKSISKKIDDGKGTLGLLLNDESVAHKLTNTIDSLQATITNFKSASINTKKVLANLHEFSGKLNKSGNSLNEIVSDTTMYNSLKGSLSQLRSATNSINRLSGNLNRISNKVNQKDNVAGVLLSDSAAASAMQNTLRNLETSSKKLDEDLEAVQHNFLLRRFFKKREKDKLK